MPSKRQTELARWFLALATIRALEVELLATCECPDPDVVAAYRQSQEQAKRLEVGLGFRV